MALTRISPHHPEPKFTQSAFRLFAERLVSGGLPNSVATLSGRCDRRWL